MPLNSEAAAVNVLETPSYFQGRWLVDNYLNQFKDLIEHSGYSDPKTIVVKFRQGLNCQMSMALAGMTYRRPSDTDPKAWFRLAVRMDQNRLPPATQPSSSQHKPYSDGLPTCSGCPCRTLCPLQPVTRQSCPDGHRCDLEG